MHKKSSGGHLPLGQLTALPHAPKEMEGEIAPHVILKVGAYGLKHFVI